MQKNSHEKRGFTLAEKWVIWGVFCLLIGLSTYRFSVFAGLMLLSAGIFLFSRKERIVLALLLCAAGLANLIFSKYLL